MNDPQPGQFSAADLAPSDDERRAGRLAIADRIATTVAVLATGGWIGGLVALGACAAPFVFRLTPAPFSGDAMGAAFARFDQIAIGASAAVLAAEIVRTWAGRGRRPGPAARLRRIVAVVMAMGAAYGGLVLTPRILELHRAGVRRGFGPEGDDLERVHVRAERVGKAEVALGALLIGLHVFTIGVRRPEDDPEDDAPAPLPPGGG
jgi:hypothetical protein